MNGPATDLSIRYVLVLLFFLTECQLAYSIVSFNDDDFLISQSFISFGEHDFFGLLLELDELIFVFAPSGILLFVFTLTILKILNCLLYVTTLFFIILVCFIDLSLLVEERWSFSRLGKLEPHVGRSPTVFKHALRLYLDFLLFYASLRFIIVARCHLLEAPRMMLIINLLFVTERAVLIRPY